MQYTETETLAHSKCEAEKSVTTADTHQHVRFINIIANSHGIETAKKHA